MSSSMAQNPTQSAKLLEYFDNPHLHSRYLSFGEMGASGCYDGLQLRSVFQPVLLASTMKPFAFEALLRASNEQGLAIPPHRAFSLPKKSKEIVFFDRLCRTIHAVNFALQAEPGNVLFLNVDGQHLLHVDGGAHGDAFETLLGYCGLSPRQVVLEILESRINDLGRLMEAIASYQSRGFRIAIDDFGCQHSNFDRLWQLTPDFVKLDRSFMVQSMVSSRARLVLPIGNHP